MCHFTEGVQDSQREATSLHNPPVVKERTVVSREDLGQRNPHGVRGDLKRPHLEMGLCIPLLPSIPYPPFASVDFRLLR